jgi:hypothetical protein
VTAADNYVPADDLISMLGMEELSATWTRAAST